MASLEVVLGRMRVLHPDLPDELGLFLAEKATRAVPGGFVWRFDPLHRTTAPMPFQKALFAGFLRAIRARTLVVVGERGLRLDDEDERLACIAGARRVELSAVGHMIHWLAPERLSTLVAENILQIGPSADPHP
jgi:pimeloyl-ACP methyl ester carboxylesterase